jgi:hypothetical protein
VVLRPALTDGLPLAPMALAGYLSAAYGQSLRLTQIWTLVLCPFSLGRVLLRVVIADEPTGTLAPWAGNLVRLTAQI